MNFYQAFFSEMNTFFPNCKKLKWRDTEILRGRNQRFLNSKFKTLYFMIRDYLPLLNFVRQLCTCLYINGFFVEEMVFCYQNCSNLLWERIVLVIEKKIEIWGWRSRIFKNFEITKTIYSNSEGLEQFLVTEYFLTCSWRFLGSNELEQLEFKLENNIGI